MQIDLSDLKVGDKVYSGTCGEGILNDFSTGYPIVTFALPPNSFSLTFSKDGKCFDYDAHPTLFHSKQEWLEYVKWACRERKYVLAKDIDENFKAGCRVESTSKYLWVYNDNNNACEILAYLQTEPKEDAIDRLIKTGWIKEVE